MKKYSTLWESITNSNLDSSQHEEVYNLVVEEYEDMGDDPNEADTTDIYEIAEASGLDNFVE